MALSLALQAELPREVTCHAWSKDLQYLAVCHGESEVYVYRWIRGRDVAPDDALLRVAQLDEHDQPVAAMDWAPTGLLVTCSHDRTCHVWQHDSGHWRQQLVVTRLQRAALCVAWSPNSAHFAIGSAMKSVYVCTHDPENQWWAGRLIRRAHDSSVLCLAWHPGGAMIATGSSDGHFRILSVADETNSTQGNGGVSEAPGGAGRHAAASSTTAQGQHKFGDVLVEQDAGAWVHALAWSTDGDRLLVASHRSVLLLYDPFPPAGASNGAAVREVLLPSLPCSCVAALGHTQFVASGWDGCMFLLQKQAAAAPSGDAKDWALEQYGGMIWDQALDDELVDEDAAAAQLAACTLADNTIFTAQSKVADLEVIHGLDVAPVAGAVAVTARTHISLVHADGHLCLFAVGVQGVSGRGSSDDGFAPA